MTAKGILVVVDDPGWRKFRGLMPRLERAAAAAARAARLRGSLTILLSSDRKLRSLNRAFRGKDRPTNVLSFPAAPNSGHYRGDVALALGVTRREAKASNKNVSDHATHLVVHGVLHLAGYDHVRVRDAKMMEALEIKILHRLGITDPYEAAG
ncbi:MAG TPA: rRNA maturation RNase YbeY [Rhizomicrobium sp.]|jgi:probable rRNA maturation factor|nr:rRNA maturation RNase YbeY [Rhizomicrobium sp.]